MPCHSTKLLLSSSSLCIESLGSSMYMIMSSVNSECLTSSFPIEFFDCSFLIITSASTSNSILKSSGESKHPCHVPDLSEKTSTFPPLSIMLTLGFSYIILIMLWIVLCLRF